MEALWPDALSIPFEGNTGGSYTSGPFRGVLHTTQSKNYNPSTKEYYGHSNPPHFTLVWRRTKAVMYQHYSIKVAARALENRLDPENLQTNRYSAIQIEIAWRAEEITQLPDPMVEMLGKWMRWVEQQTGIRKVNPPFLKNDAYGAGSKSRMSTDEWRNFNGWCGHQHVPENAHWDPGPIDIARLYSIT